MLFSSVLLLRGMPLCVLLLNVMLVQDEFKDLYKLACVANARGVSLVSSQSSPTADCRFKSAPALCSTALAFITALAVLTASSFCTGGTGPTPHTATLALPPGPLWAHSSTVPGL